MIDGLAPHPQTTAADLVWVDEIPAHWSVARVKWSFHIQLGKMLQNAPVGGDDTEVRYLKAQHVQWQRVKVDDLPTMWASASDLEQFGVRQGDLLVCEGGEGGRCGMLGPMEGPAIIQNALHRVRPRGEALNKYLMYVMATIGQRGWFEALNEKATIAHFTSDKFGALAIPLPPREEQEAIVRFLDHADERIQRYIRAKQKLIKLLEEQKQAIIHRAVTRGLDPNVPLKPSGIDWLGDIPAHWNVVTLRRVVSRVVDGPHHSPNYVDNGVPFLSARNIKTDRWSLDDAKFISEQDYEDLSRRVTPEIGDVLYTKGGTTGVARVVDLPFRFQVWVHVAVLKVEKDKVVPDYLAFVLNSPRCYEQAQLFTRGATNQDLGLGRMQAIVFALPPIRDQPALLEMLREQTEGLTLALDRVRREIDLLREFRTSLVADVVVGKRDVRDAARGLSEDAERAEIDESDVRAVTQS